MMLQRVGGGVGGGQHFHVELLEQRARAKFRFGQLLRNLIINGLRGLAGQLLLDAEHMMQRIINPDAGGRAAKQVEVIGKNLPDFTMILLHRAAVAARDAQVFQRDAL